MVTRHALRNALIPVITVLGPTIAGLLTGSFVVEKIFAIPGLGYYFVNSVSQRDYTTIMGVTIFYAAFLMAMVLLVDVDVYKRQGSTALPPIPGIRAGALPRCCSSA